MVEGLLVVLKLAAEVTHPIDVELTSACVDRSRVVALAKALTFN